MRRPLRGSLLHEFFEALGDLSTRCTQRNREQAWFPLPALIGTDESQPVIPWWVALPQSPPPLDRPNSECCTVVLPVERFTANGDECLNRLCQPRGQPQSRPYRSWSKVLTACHLRSHLCALAAFSKTFFSAYRPPKAEHYRSSTILQTGNRQWSRQTTSVLR